jgi:hypothetical protein
MKLTPLESATLDFARKYADRILNVRSERSEAMDAAKARIAKKMMERGIPIDDIVEMTELCKDDVEKLKDGSPICWWHSGGIAENTAREIRDAMETGIKLLARKWLNEGLSEELVMEYLGLNEYDIGHIQAGLFF